MFLIVSACNQVEHIAVHILAHVFESGITAKIVLPLPLQTMIL